MRKMVTWTLLLPNALCSCGLAVDSENPASYVLLEICKINLIASLIVLYLLIEHARERVDLRTILTTLVKVKSASSQLAHTTGT